MTKSRKRRILVVDDEPIIADTLTAILRGSGYDARTRYDGRSAVEECALSAPDLVISDLLMPAMNGIELGIEIRRRYPACRILLFSAMGISVDLVVKAKREGHCFELLGKPVHPVELLTLIARGFAEDTASESPGETGRSRPPALARSGTGGIPRDVRGQQDVG